MGLLQKSKLICEVCLLLAFFFVDVRLILNNSQALLLDNQTDFFVGTRFQDFKINCFRTTQKLLNLDVFLSFLSTCFRSSLMTGCIPYYWRLRKAQLKKILGDKI